jgi:hypothetical protein
MKVELIVPIANLHGKLNGKAPFYFKTINGKTYAQRCPKRTARPTTNQVVARQRFAAIAQTVALMRRQGSLLSRQELWTLASAAYDAAHK